MPRKHQKPSAISTLLAWMPPKPSAVSTFSVQGLKNRRHFNVYAAKF